MAEESPLCEALAENLQSAIDRKLTVGEAVLIALGGATGEALAATDRRVILVREQMPILGAAAEVDCFDYPYDQISTVRVDDAVGGGHLKLILVTPPVDEKEVTLFFPPYALAKFDTAAARIRLLVEQTRSVPVSSAGSPAVNSVHTSICRQCGQPVEEGHWSYCSGCGALQGSVCVYCESPLPSGARFCSRCGTPADTSRPPNCSGCGRLFSTVFAFCPFCGTAQGERCARCAGRILDGWRHCPACGQEVSLADVGTRSFNGASNQSSPKSEPGTAEEHNSVGRRLYEEENLAEAIAHFQTAIEMDPANPLYRCNLGVAFAELGQDEAAREEYEAAIRLAPNDPTAYLNLGYFHSERENNQEAMTALRKVIEIAPGTPEAEEAAQIMDSVGET